MAIKALHAVVEGEVQGVGFRYSAMREARTLAIVGWVRNTESGDVEVWAEGEEKDLAEFQGWLGVGPSGAWVRAVRLSWETPRGIYNSFGVAF
jgi:acylphosphatase